MARLKVRDRRMVRQSSPQCSRGSDRGEGHWPRQSGPFLYPTPGGERGSVSGGENGGGLEKKQLAANPPPPLLQCTHPQGGRWGRGTLEGRRVGGPRPEGTRFQHNGRPSPGPQGHRHNTAPVWGAGLGRKQLVGFSRPSVTPTICPSPRSPRRQTAAAPDPASGRRLLVDGKPPFPFPADQSKRTQTTPFKTGRYGFYFFGREKQIFENNTDRATLAPNTEG